MIRPIAHFRASQNRLARERLVLSVWMERAAALRNRVSARVLVTARRGSLAAELEMLVARSKEERRHVASMLLQLLSTGGLSVAAGLRRDQEWVEWSRHARR